MANELTVESALKELREMFGSTRLQVEVMGAHYSDDRPQDAPSIIARVFVGQKDFHGPTLSEAMAQVRKWKDQQS